MRGIIRDYDSSQLINELLQNADDAGSKYFRVCLDKRCGAFGSCSLLSPSMAEFQGPALYQYDDASFKPDDFESIQKVGDGLKRGDPTKTGQFGLGFNSCYHLTDLPQFMSGKYFVCFDPHRKYLPALGGGSTGSFYDLTANVDAGRVCAPAHAASVFADTYPDQCRPFVGMFGCDARGNWQAPELWDHRKTASATSNSTTTSGSGTLFRFPLRSKSVSLASDIKRNSRYASLEQEACDAECEVLLPFIREAARKLLFLKSVEFIEVYVWEAGQSGMKQLLRAGLDQLTPQVRLQRATTANFLRTLMETPSAPKSLISSSFDLFGSRKPAVAAESTGNSGGASKCDDDGTSLGRLASKLGRYRDALKRLIKNSAAHTPRPLYPLRVNSRQFVGAVVKKGIFGNSSTSSGAGTEGYVSTVEQFVVASCFGYVSDLEFASRADVISQGLCLVPLASVALLVGQCSGGSALKAGGDRQAGTVFCCLPTSMRSGLPVLIDGRWELTRDRNHFAGYVVAGEAARGVEMRGDASALRTEWNLRVARLAGAAYARLLHALSLTQLPRLVNQYPSSTAMSSLLADLEKLLRPELYYCFFPDVGKMNNSHPVWYECVKTVYELLGNSQAPQWKGLIPQSTTEIEFLCPYEDEEAVEGSGARWMGASSAYFIGANTSTAPGSINSANALSAAGVPKLVLDCLVVYNRTHSGVGEFCPLTSAPLFVLDAMLVYNIQAKGLLSPSNLRDWLRMRNLFSPLNSSNSNSTGASSQQGILMHHVVACLEYVLSDFVGCSGVTVMEAMRGVQLLCVETTYDRIPSWELLPFGGASPGGTRALPLVMLDWSVSGTNASVKSPGAGWLLLRSRRGSSATARELDQELKRLVRFIEPSTAACLLPHRQTLQLNEFSPTMLVTEVLGKLSMEMLAVRVTPTGGGGASHQKGCSYAMAEPEEGCLFSRPWLLQFWSFIHAYINEKLAGGVRCSELAELGSLDDFPVVPCLDGTLQPLKGCNDIVYCSESVAMDSVADRVRAALMTVGVSFIDQEFYRAATAGPYSCAGSTHGAGIRSLELLSDRYRVMEFRPRDVLQLLWAAWHRKRQLCVPDRDVLLEYFAIHVGSLTDNDIESKLVFLPIFQTEETHGQMAAASVNGSVGENDNDISKFYTALKRLPDAPVGGAGSGQLTSSSDSSAQLLFTLPEFEDETGVTFAVPNMPMAHFVHRPTTASRRGALGSVVSAGILQTQRSLFDELFGRMGIKPLSRVDFYAKYVLIEEYWRSISSAQRVSFLSDIRANFYSMKSVPIAEAALSLTALSRLGCGSRRFGDFIVQVPIIWTRSAEAYSDSVNGSGSGNNVTEDSVVPKRKSVFGALFKKNQSTKGDLNPAGAGDSLGSKASVVTPGWVNVTELLDPREPLLQQFFPGRLPPEELCTPDWVSFLQQLGLASSVTKEQVLACARLVSGEYVAAMATPSPDEVLLQATAKRAKAVTTYLFSNFSSLVPHLAPSGRPGSMTEAQWLEELSSLYIAQVWKEPPSGAEVVTGSFRGGGLTQFKDCVMPIGSSSGSSSNSSVGAGYSRTYCCSWSARTIVRSFGCYVSSACLSGLGVKAYASLEDTINHLTYLCYLPPTKLQEVSAWGREDKHVGDLERQLGYIYEHLSMFVTGSGNGNDNYFDMIRGSLRDVPCVLLCCAAGANASQHRYEFVRGDQIYREMPREVPPFAYGLNQLVGYLQDYYLDRTGPSRVCGRVRGGISCPLFDALGIEVAPSISMLMSWNKRLGEEAHQTTRTLGRRLEGDKLSDTIYILTLLASEIAGLSMFQADASGQKSSTPLPASERLAWLEENIYTHLEVPDTGGLLCRVRSSGSSSTAGVALLDDGSWLDGKIDKTKLHIVHSGLTDEDAVDLGVYRLSSLVEERCGSIVTVDAASLRRTPEFVDALELVSRWRENLCSPYFSVAVRRSMQHCIGTRPGMIGDGAGNRARSGPGGGVSKESDAFGSSTNERIYRLNKVRFEFASTILCKYVVNIPATRACEGFLIDVSCSGNAVSAAAMLQYNADGLAPTIHVMVPVPGDKSGNIGALSYWRRRWLPNICIQLSKYIVGSPGKPNGEDGSGGGAAASLLRGVLSELIACESAERDMMDVLDAWQIPYSKNDAANCTLGRVINVTVERASAVEAGGRLYVVRYDSGTSSTAESRRILRRCGTSEVGVGTFVLISKEVGSSRLLRAGESVGFTQGRIENVNGKLRGDYTGKNSMFFGKSKPVLPPDGLSTVLVALSPDLLTQEISANDLWLLDTSSQMLDSALGSGVGAGFDGAGGASLARGLGRRAGGVGQVVVQDVDDDGDGLGTGSISLRRAVRGTGATIGTVGTTVFDDIYRLNPVLLDGLRDNISLLLAECGGAGENSSMSASFGLFCHCTDGGCDIAPALTLQLQKLSMEINDQLLVLERSVSESSDAAVQADAARRSEEALEGLCLVTQLAEETQALDTELLRCGHDISGTQTRLLVRSTVQAQENSFQKLLQCVRRASKEEDRGRWGIVGMGGNAAETASNGRMLFTALDPTWEESERALLAHLQAKDAAQTGLLEEEPPGIDSFVLAAHGVSGANNDPVATFERNQHTGEITNILTNPSAGQVQSKVEVRPGFDLVRVGNFSESVEGLQDVAFFHHRLTLSEFTPERECLVRQCCAVLRDVAQGVFDYDPAFITLFYEVGATSRFIRQKLMFNLAPVEAHAIANRIVDIRLDPFCYTYFYGLCVHKLAHFFDVVHGTRHNYFMNEFRCNYICQWMDLLADKGFDNVEALPYAKEHLWKVLF